MNSSSEIKALAYERLAEAQILCDAQKYDGAFYLAGYSVELMLKAKICEHWDIDGLFSKDFVLEDISTKIIGEVKKSIQTHDLKILFIYSGLVKKFQPAKDNNSKLMKTYGYLMSISTNDNNQRIEWSEQARYLPIGSQKAVEVKAFIQLLNDENGLLKWIENN
jgi:hypothetical protein